jgi:hypothetical protein
MQQRKVDWSASNESPETGFKEVNRIRSGKSACANRSQKPLHKGATRKLRCRRANVRFAGNMSGM